MKRAIFVLIAVRFVTIAATESFADVADSNTVSASSFQSLGSDIEVPLQCQPEEASVVEGSIEETISVEPTLQN